MNSIIEIDHLSKRFGEVQAVKDLSFRVKEGELFAFLGVNGAGKSTTINILCGQMPKDAGSVRIDGKSLDEEPDAIKRSLGVVFQNSALDKDLTVRENLQSRAALYGIRGKDFRERLTELAELLDFKDLVKRPLGKLSGGQRRRIDIARALLHRPRILILDEPTAVLTPQETDELIVLLKNMSKELSIIFISHKLNEVKALSDKVSILRHGRVVFNGKTEDYSPSEIAALMTGHEVEIASNSGERRDGKVALSIENLVVKSDRGFNALDGFDLQVKEGEIVGLAGVSGNGQRELAEAINGIRKTDGGKILFYGDEIQNLSPREVIKKGMGYIPEERNTEGIVPSMSIKENIILKDSNDRFSLHHILKDKDIEKYASLLRENYDIRSPSIHVAAGSLSGGNIQKVILAREIDRKPKFLVCVYPIRGLDMGAAEFIHRLLLDLRNKGVGILLISEELEEIMNLSDRIAVIFKGKNQKMMDASEATTDKLGILMAGVNDEA